MESEDGSDGVLMNDSQHSSPAYDNEAAIEPETRPPPLSRSSTYGKKCWICMSDASEDDPNNPPVWRSPCKCSLTAHESCLLDWVAELEHPKNNKKTKSQIQCPSCKSEIKISRPRSFIVDGYRSVDRALGKLVLPGLGLGALGMVTTAFWVHGFESVYLVFGYEDAFQIFERASKKPSRLFAYALIPINLIFSRTHYAEFVLPGGTLFLLSTQLSDRFEIDMTVWPPRASTVFACLPAMRSMYGWLYHKTFCNLNKKWLEEIRPRHGQQEQETQGNDEMDPQRGGIVVNDDVNGNDIGDGLQDMAEDGEVVLEVQIGPENQQGNNVHHILGERGDQWIDGTSSIGQTVLGSLAFPAVAATMGSLVKFALPTSWLSSANTMNGRPGLMRTKWGRSVVGGCLFVILKDALILYCRWRLAKSHKSRRILNYDKKTQKYSI
ncbi:hypothetical protein RBB50_006130 [Rhinocladiella similis]|jgi:hypothetical protein